MESTQVSDLLHRAQRVLDVHGYKDEADHIVYSDRFVRLIKGPDGVGSWLYVGLVSSDGASHRVYMTGVETGVDPYLAQIAIDNLRRIMVLDDLSRI